MVGDGTSREAGVTRRLDCLTRRQQTIGRGRVNVQISKAVHGSRLTRRTRLLLQETPLAGANYLSMIPTMRFVAVVCACGLMIALSGGWPVLLPASIVLLSVLVVAAIAEWRVLSRARPEVVRVCDDKLSLGAPNPVRLRVRNPGFAGLSGAIRDEHPEGTDADRNVLPLSLPPRSERELLYHVNPPKRGNFEFGDTFVRLHGALGLVTRQIRFGTRRGVRVYPNMLDMRRYEIGLKRQRAIQPGQRLVRVRGRGTDFESLRDYTPDDEFRAIDWKATARRAKPIARQYQEEKSQNVVLMLDCGRTMGPVIDNLTRLDHAVNAAMMLAQVASLKGDKIGLMAFGDDIITFSPPRQGKSQFLRLLNLAYDLKDAEGDSNYTRAISYLTSRWTRRSLVVLFTDLVDPESSAPLMAQVASLARKHLCICVTMSDPAVVAAASGLVSDVDAAFTSAAARQAIQARNLARHHLAAAGAIVVDVEPQDFTPAVVNAYLDIKARARL